MNKTRLKIKILIPFAAAAVFGLIGYGYYRIFSLSDEVGRISSELASTTAIFAGKTDQLEGADIALGQKLTLLSSNLSATDQDIQKTKKKMTTEPKQKSTFLPFLSMLVIVVQKVHLDVFVG